MKKTTTQIGAVSAAALIASMGIVPLAALGQETGPGVDSPIQPKDIVLGKTINASPAIDTANKEFSFTFTPTDNVAKSLDPASNAANDVDAYMDGPNISVVLKAGAMTGDIQYLEEKLPFSDNPVDDGFTHAGLYEYIVTEDSPGVGWVSNTEKYVLRIYVVNDGNGLAYSTVTVTKATPDTDPGTGEPTGTYSPGNKINGTETNATETVPSADEGAQDQQINTVTPGSDAGLSTGFMFTNSADFSSLNGDLVISKTTTGTYADKTHAFPFAVEITVPAGVAAADYDVAFTGSAAAAASETGIAGGKVNLVGGTAKTVNVEIPNGGTMTIADLPAGTTYSVTETGTTVNGAAYTPTATLNNAAVTSSGLGTAGGTPTVSIALDTTDTAHDTPAEVTMIPSSGSSTLAFTNTLAEGGQPSPTGIVTMFAPYALLLVAGGVAAYVVVRNRKKNESEE